MPDYGIPVAAYRAGLVAELAQPNLTREHKAAIVTELESLGQRTADEDRAAIEAATLGPNTVGRAPSGDVVQDHSDEVNVATAPDVASPVPEEQKSVASSSKGKSGPGIDPSPEVVPTATDTVPMQGGN